MTAPSEEGSGLVVGGKMIVGTGIHGPRDALLRKAAAALGELEGQAFVPEGRLDRAFMAGDRRATRVSLTHPHYSGSPDYENSWLSLSVDTYEPEPWDVVFVSIHMGSPGAQLALEWEIGLAVMPRLVAALDPALAFMNAWSLDNDGGIFPPGGPAPEGSIPPIFTAWTFVGRRAGPEALRDLAQLPAVSSTSLGEGWLVRAVDHVSDVPRPDFLSALEALGDSATTYLPPNLRDRG